MFKFVLITALILFSTAAKASDAMTCFGDSYLTKFNGLWIHQSFEKSLDDTRSWYDALNKVDSNYASIKIDESGLHFNLNWHEGDIPNDKCVRMSDDGLWVMEKWKPEIWIGPFHKVGSSKTDESKYYLNRLFSGCFISDKNDRWCFSDSGITINEKKFPTKLQMDITEGPLYGTALFVEGRKLPFLVLVPKANNVLAIFEDDWASSEDRKPVDVNHDKPWQILRRVR
ncbi:hypothetical protein [Sapientia aquatica]|uniref:Uncharacterized protein n=1 Tax=Sapientia aquatica TaxID=1549640 RepID=A0A4R5W2A8_9BURK|nr:hypothetical protein [Sapientia aquatica]TDK66404.1 hypothetical protein E2I14_07980 [Sapientia aquatica]